MPGQSTPQAQTYTDRGYGQEIKGPQIELYVDEGSAHFGTDFYQMRGMNIVGTFLSATSVGGGQETVRAARGKQHVDISDSELSSRVKTALAGFMRSRVMEPVEVDQANYMIDDILDDRQLNGSAPHRSTNQR